MKLSEFKADMLARVDAFVENWLENNVSEPLDWPLEMEPGDWYDQFLIYEGTK